MNVWIKLFKFTSFHLNGSCGVRKELEKSKVCVVTKYNRSLATETKNNERYCRDYRRAWIYPIIEYIRPLTYPKFTVKFDICRISDHLRWCRQRRRDERQWVRPLGIFSLSLSCRCLCSFTSWLLQLSSFWQSSVSPKQTTEGSEQRRSPCSESF